MTNGEEIRARAVVKPIPTLLIALRSVDLQTKQPQKASVERSDTCVVPAAGVVAEAMLALVLADALLEKTGGDSLDEVLAHLARRASNSSNSPGSAPGVRGAASAVAPAGCSRGRARLVSKARGHSGGVRERRVRRRSCGARSRSAEPGPQLG